MRSEESIYRHSDVVQPWRIWKLEFLEQFVNLDVGVCDDVEHHDVDKGSEKKSAECQVSSYHDLVLSTMSGMYLSSVNSLTVHPRPPQRQKTKGMLENSTTSLVPPPHSANRPVNGS